MGMKKPKREKSPRQPEPAHSPGTNENGTGLRAAGVNPAYLAAIVECSQDAIMSFTPDGIILTWNAAAKKLLGYSAAEMIGRHRSILVPEDRLAESERILKVAASGERVPLFETVRRRKDGTHVNMEVALSPITEKGRVTAIALIARDISKRKQAEQKLRETEERLRSVLESAPDAMMIVNRDGKIELVNRQAEILFGYTRQELIGKAVLMLMPSRFRRSHRAKHEEFVAAPANRAMGGGTSFPARRKDGREFPAEISLSPLKTEHGLLICTVIRDITERKRTEDAIRTLNAELEERVAARTASLLTSTKTLMKSVADLQQEREERQRLEREVIEISEAERERIGQDLHDELGQQLAGLRFFSSALEQRLRAASSPEADAAATISDTLNHALTLTRSLARGLQPVVPEPGGLMAALRGLAARSSGMFKVRARFFCRRPVQVRDSATATYLYRIAQEAVTNAARHGRAKHISILLSSTANELILSVNDDGTGVRNATSGHEGMGIRTMRYRAGALGGSLIFRDRPSGGTSVVCTIPAHAEPAPKEH